MTLLPMMYSLIPLTVYLRNPSDVALDVRLCQQMDTKNMGNDEKELPIRQCTTSSALPPKAVSATKQCVIHIWKGRPAERVPRRGRQPGQRARAILHFFFAKYVCQGQGSEGVAGSDAKSNTYIHSVIETGWYLGKYLMSAIVFKNLSLLSN